RRMRRAVGFGLLKVLFPLGTTIAGDRDQFRAMEKRTDRHLIPSPMTLGCIKADTGTQPSVVEYRYAKHAEVFLPLHFDLHPAGDQGEPDDIVYHDCQPRDQRSVKPANHGYRYALEVFDMRGCRAGSPFMRSVYTETPRVIFDHPGPVGQRM